MGRGREEVRVEAAWCLLPSGLCSGNFQKGEVSLPWAAEELWSTERMRITSFPTTCLGPQSSSPHLYFGAPGPLKGLPSLPGPMQGATLRS